MSKKILLLVLVIFGVGYYLRVMFLPANSLTFGYDQARDATHALQIISGDLKILGPPASTPGLHHGVFYFYVLAPAYLFGKGSPIAAAYWIAFLNTCTVLTVFYLAYRFSKRVEAGLLAALLFAISFEATQYATWLSNPTIAIWTVPLIYLGLWTWLMDKKKWGALVCGVGLGLSIQANIFLLYHAVPVLMWLWYSRKRISKQSIGGFIITLLLCTLTMILSEVKFNFPSITGVLSLLSSQDAIIASKQFGDFIILMFNQLGRTYAFNSYPGNIGYGGLFVLLLMFLAYRSWDKKGLNWQPFLLSWLLAHLTVVSVGGTATPFLMVGIGPAVSILIALFMSQWWKSKKALTIVLLALLVYGNISMMLRENSKGSTIFAIQKDMLLSKQLKAIDYTYAQAYGLPFSTNSLTSPLWINIVWTYLYKWYGLPKYGYLPTWYGKSQIGQLDSLNEGSEQLRFVILEPMGGIPPKYLDELINSEDSTSELVDQINFGELGVQKREALQ